MQKEHVPIEQLSCNHLEKLLGKEYELERTKNKGRLPVSTHESWIRMNDFTEFQRGVGGN